MAQDKTQDQDNIVAATGTDGPRPPSLSARLASATTSAASPAPAPPTPASTPSKETKGNRDAPPAAPPPLPGGTKATTAAPPPPPLPPRSSDAAPKAPGAAATEPRDESGQTDLLAARMSATATMAARAQRPAEKDGDEPAAPLPPPPESSAAAERAARREARRRPAGPVRERLAANDDAPSIGGLIYALQQKPSSKPFQYAAIGSAVWALLGAGAMWLSFSAENESLVALLQKPTTFLLLSAVTVPIVVIWFLSLLAWRSEELRLRSSTMAEVAIRLAEPDRLAEQSTASLGQAVRRQVSFMNDAVSRALGRAGELEALVHNEVSALERSYEENERKIRGLIQELSGERLALLRTSEDVHSTLRSLGSEVPALIEKLSSQQAKLAGIIEGAGDNLTMLETSLAQGARQLESSVGSRTQELKAVLENYSGSLDQNMQARTEQMQAVLDNYTGRVETALVSRTEEMQTVLESYTEAVDGALHTRTEQMHQMLADHSGTLGATLNDTTREMGRTLETHGTEMRTMLEDHSGRMGKSLGDSTGNMQVMLETYTSALAEALASRTEEMQEAFEGYMLTLDNSISSRTDNLQAVFEEYARALDTTLASRAEELDQQLVSRTRALDDAFNDRLRLFDETIVRTTTAIDEAVGEKALALTSALDSHAKNFRDTITRQTADIDDTLSNGINAVRRSSENVTRQSLKAIEGLASQSDLLKRVSENLLGQINSVTNRFENQGQLIMQAANALESANYKIDTALKQRHSELSGTLDRLSHKADEFSEFMAGYSDTLEDKLSEAEQRAKAAAEQLRQGAQTHQRETIADLERFREEAGAHSQRALTDLRNRFSTVSDEVSSQLGDLTSRFDRTSEEVRAKAHEASLAIEEEQARLREKLATMPGNSRESAEAMRRALQDQLSALEQLSDIASREGRNRDVTQPDGVGGHPMIANTAPPAGSSHAYPGDNRRSANVDTERQLSSLSSSLARELHARPLRQGATASAPPASSPVASSHTGKAQTTARAAAGPGAPRPAASDQTSRHAAAPAGSSSPGGDPRMAGAQPRPAAPAQAAQGDNWSLGDLLKRASFDDDSAADAALGDPDAKRPAAHAEGPSPGPGSLPDVGLMVSAIDTSTAQEIWGRLRNGQRGILVPSLYPPPARAAFDELRRRFASEPALRDAIGRFLADFERTVRAAEEKDASGQLVHSHLVSDMGRAYLFLAHVSGRLDG